MKKIRTFLAALLAVTALVATPVANAQFFKWGPRVGVNINKFSFNKDVVHYLKDSENRAGFTGGLMMEFTVPVVGIGVDVSAMYVRRSFDWKEGAAIIKTNQDYIDIPLNLKWKINIPVINNIIRPYIATGPDFAILASKEAINEALNAKKCNVSWNIGAGVELIKHLQIGATYGIGLGKAVTGMFHNLSSSDNLKQYEKIDGKNHYWTVTAAWLF